MTNLMFPGSDVRSSLASCATITTHYVHTRLFAAYQRGTSCGQCSSSKKTGCGDGEQWVTPSALKRLSHSGQPTLPVCAHFLLHVVISPAQFAGCRTVGNKKKKTLLRGGIKEQRINYCCLVSPPKPV